MTVQSGEAEYNGTDILLTGKVHVQHEVGTMQASRLKASPDLENEAPFSHFTLNQDVIITLKDGSKLSCAQAEINYPQLKGNFWGDEQQPQVIYTDPSEDKLMVKGDKMEIIFLRTEDSPQQSHQSLVKQILFDQNVSVDYRQSYHALADHALYQRNSEAGVDGLLQLYKDDQGLCEVSNPNGDRIYADRMSIDTKNKLLLMDKPRGSFQSLAKAGEKQPPIQFSSDNLVWDDASHKIVLKEHVNIHQGTSETLKTDNEVQIVQESAKGKRGIRSLTSPAETELYYLDPQKGITHKIVCHGPLHIDHEHSTALLQSPVGADGKIAEEQQVFFEDLMGEFYADEVLVNYAYREQNLIPTNLTLKGHVRLFNRFDGHLTESASVLQYALADKLEYNPDTKEILLSSDSGNRVLFFDQVNQINMSAPSVKLKRDPVTRKGMIQGQGDVRFTFATHEFDQIKKHFKIEDKKK
jgi:lipopolysaccharide export system protein LptA